MSKYIDAEKLKAGIEKIRQEMIKNGEQKDLHDAEIIRRSVINSCNVFLALIPSLQQEQPEVDLEKELDAFIKSGKAIKEENCGTYTTTYIDPLKVARHFYNLGLNARKEE